jgi:hypothetical protein
MNYSNIAIHMLNFLVEQEEYCYNGISPLRNYLLCFSANLAINTKNSELALCKTSGLAGTEPILQAGH